MILPSALPLQVPITGSIEHRLGADGTGTARSMVTVMRLPRAFFHLDSQGSSCQIRGPASPGTMRLMFWAGQAAKTGTTPAPMRQMTIRPNNMYFLVFILLPSSSQL